MNIRPRLLSGFLLVALLVVAVAYLAVSLSGDIGKLRSVELPMEQNLREVEVSIWEAIHAADAFRATADPYYLELYHRQLGDVDEFFPKYAALLDTPAERQLAEEFEILWAQAKNAGASMLEFVKKEKNAQDKLFIHVDTADDIIDFKIQAKFSPSDPQLLAKEQSLREVEVSVWEAIHAAEQYTGLTKNIERAGHAQKTFAELMEKQFEDVTEFWVIYKALAVAENEAKAIAEFEAEWGKAVDVGRKLMTIHDQTEHHFSTLYKLVDQADDVIDHKLQKQIEARISDRDRAARMAKTVTIAMSVLAIISAIGIGLFIARSIWRPITKLTNATGELADGNLGYRIGSTRRDEIGALARAFDHMSSEMQAASERLESEITERKRAKDELQQKMDQLERFNRLSTGRELRMIEMKRKANEAARKAGIAPPYELSELHDADNVESDAPDSSTPAERQV